MMKLTKLRSLAVLAVAALAIPFSAYAQKKPHIIVVTHGQVSDSFWVVVKNGVEAAAKETSSAVDYRAPEKFDMVAMSQLIDAAVASKLRNHLLVVPIHEGRVRLSADRRRGSCPCDRRCSRR